MTLSRPGREFELFHVVGVNLVSSRPMQHGRQSARTWVSEHEQSHAVQFRSRVSPVTYRLSETSSPSRVSFTGLRTA
jgi:hypothetical protein